MGEMWVTASPIKDIHKGYIGQQVVCLKVLRFFSSQEDREKRLGKVAYIRWCPLGCLTLIPQQDFSREVLVWSQLSHPNVLPFLGASKTLFPSFCLISPWMNNGNILAYLKTHPEHNRLNSVRCLNNVHF